MRWRSWLRTRRRGLGYRMMWRVAKLDSTVIDGIPVRYGAAFTPGEPEAYLAVVREALELLAASDPRWIRRARCVLRGILISEGSLGAVGWFHPPTRLCILHPKYVLGKKAGIPFVAATIVHETMHGLVHAHGIAYGRHAVRIERICHQVGLAATKRFGCGRDIRLASSYLSDVKAIHSREAALHHWLNDVWSLDVPTWYWRVFLKPRAQRVERRLKRLSAEGASGSKAA